MTHATALDLPRATRTTPMFLWGILSGIVLSVTPFLAQAEIVQAEIAQDENAQAENTQPEITTTHAYSNFDAAKYGPDFAHLDYVNPDAPKGGEISVWSRGAFDSFNPFARQGTTAANVSMGYESLLVATADDPYGVYCYLCTTMQYPEDLSWVIFNLRDDVTFWDGSKMTAQDVAFSHNLFREQGIAEYRNIIDGFFEDFEVLGPYQIKFSFSKTAPKRDRISFAGGIQVFSKAWFDATQTRLDERSDSLFMATGPYQLGDFDYGRNVTYFRTPDFWGENHPMNIGQNNFDEIKVVYFADTTAAMEGFKAGAYTFRRENSSQSWAEDYGFPNITNGHVIKTTFENGDVGTAQSFIFNLDRPIWQDARLREAFGLMFNFEWSNETLFRGIYTRVDSFWPGTDLAAKGAPSDGERALLQPLVDGGLLDRAILTQDARVPPVNGSAKNRPDRKVYRRASGLLEDAGWEIGDSGFLEKDGQILKAVFLAYSSTFDRVINPIVENLKQLGVDASLERIDIPQYIERTRSGDFDLVTHSFSMGFEPSTSLEQWFHSKTADDSSRNLMRLRNDAVDALLPVVAKAHTLDELRTATQTLDRVLRHVGFTIPQWYKNIHTVAFYDVFGHPENIPPLSLGELSFWWFDHEKDAALKAQNILK